MNAVKGSGWRWTTQIAIVSCSRKAKGKLWLLHPYSFLLLLCLYPPTRSYWYVNHGILSDICSWNTSQRELLLLLWAQWRHTDWHSFKIWALPVRSTLHCANCLRRASYNGARGFDLRLGRYQCIKNVSIVKCKLYVIVEYLKSAKRWSNICFVEEWRNSVQSSCLII